MTSMIVYFPRYNFYQNISDWLYDKFINNFDYDDFYYDCNECLITDFPAFRGASFNQTKESVGDMYMWIFYIKRSHNVS